MARQKSRAAQQKSDIKKLARLGLYKPKTDHVTAYGKSQIRKYSDVLAGRATVVRAKATSYPASNIKTRKRIKIAISAAKQAKAYRGILRVRDDKIVVNYPADKKPKFNKRTGEIDVDVKNVGEVVRGRIVPVSLRSPEDLRRLESAGYYFLLPLKHGSISYQDVNDLITDIQRYGFRKDHVKRLRAQQKLTEIVVLVPRTEYKRGGGRLDEDNESEF